MLEQNERFWRILRTQSTSRNQDMMRQQIIQEIEMIDNRIKIVHDDGNIYCTKGKAEFYPCIVAHMDTVHAMIPKNDYELYYTNGTNKNELFAWE